MYTVFIIMEFVAENKGVIFFRETSVNLHKFYSFNVYIFKAYFLMNENRFC